jgi:hypothetical protein
MALVNNLTTSWSAAVVALATDEVWQVRGKGIAEIETDGTGYGVQLFGVPGINGRLDAVVLPAGATPRYKLVDGACELTRTPI